MGVERVDYYSDDEYEYAKQLEEQWFYESIKKEEEMEEYYRNEYYKELYEKEE